MIQKSFAVFMLVLCVLFSVESSAANVVKKSSSGICHDQQSSYYSRTKNFTPYNSVQACLDSGGRLSKGAITPKVSGPSGSVAGLPYKRSYFGHGWDDADGDCQNSRMEALISQSVGPVHFKDSRKCQVRSGKWISPFTGAVIYDASSIDIDHVVPLKWAWLHGANTWTDAKRLAFANDGANLWSVEASLNRSKGAKGIIDWLPPTNQCQYIARFIRVMKTYKLTVNDGELEEMNAIKASYCS
ncbi:HNH endonuclease family protein [Thalassomonas sp. M1454]|uniref:HNH endonuclease family protein n=1 Tax=Thalassomonas sp. M1454 TaxID=2594477 RepID=UPI00118107CF|nr:HNH endonuclease family protein [Thalassomonas sp. M1454]TRX56705.1 HNH endonuclease [Thalassomonas sp. M1454]